MNCDIVSKEGKERSPPLLALQYFRIFLNAEDQNK